jgi:diguanylate cyclase (GGDEF)-like protein
MKNVRFSGTTGSVLRAHLLSILFWPAAGLIVSCVAWFLLLRELADERKAVEQSTYEAVAHVAQSQADQTKRNLAMIDQILLLSRIHWQALDGKVQLTKFTELLAPSTMTLSISIFDAQGKLQVTNSVDAGAFDPTVNVAERSFFHEQTNLTKDVMFIGMPRQLAGQTSNSVRLSRRLLSKSRTFVGVVVVSIQTDALITDYDKRALGANGFLAALGEDGNIRAFHIGTDLRQKDGFSESLRALANTAQGNGLLNAGKAGTAHYVAWKSIEDFPIFVVAGVEQREALQLYSERERASLRTATGASVVMFAFVLIAMALAAKFASQRNKLQLAQEAYRKATEGGTEGFFIAQPVRDADHKVIDYIAIECNERGAAFVNMSRKNLLGKPLSSLSQHLPLDVAMSLLANAMQNGEAEDELEFKQDSRQESRHTKAKATMSNGVLAITLRDVTLEKAHVAHLERKNNEDALTGLPNRAWITKCLPIVIDRAEQNNTMLAVLFIDLDGFKAVNDTFGHAVGDELLRIVSRRLEVAVRPKDHVARIGGDEFLVVLEGLRDESEAAHVANRIVLEFQAPIVTSSGTAAVGTSIGISVFPTDATDVESLLRHADMAMYAVKTDGKNCYQFFDPAFYGAMQYRARRERELKQAISEKQFVMHYQARVDAVSGEVSSLEALVRWKHPQEGIIGPEEFIPLAEETGQILSLGELIVDEVCAQIATWTLRDQAVLPVSINISSRQFNERDIHELFVDALARHNVKASSVEIELTESTMVSDPARTAESLQALHALGIKLLVDDFGTGYSSLSMLQEMDFDILKVDKSFTKRLGTDKQSEILFGAIITMAHSLGMKVVAEGVENIAQLEILRRLKCDELQGYYFFRPNEACAVQSLIWQTQG